MAELNKFTCASVVLCYVLCALSSLGNQLTFDFVPPAPVVNQPTPGHSKPRARSGTLGIKAANKKEYMKLWRQLRKEHRRQYIDKWRAENKEWVKEYVEQYKSEHAEQTKVTNKKYWANERKRLLAKKKAEYDANPEKFTAIARENRRLHPERAKAYNEAYSISHKSELKAYRVRNKERIKEVGEEWRKKNPDLVRANVQRRWLLWDNKCWICGDKATATDHVIPLIKCGTHWPSNLRPCCKPCNSVKQSQILPKSVVMAREIILEQRGLLTPKLIGLK